MPSSAEEKILVRSLCPQEYEPLMINATACCSIGTVRRDHGVEITLSTDECMNSVDIRKTCGQSFQGSLDVHGDGLFSALGSKSSLAQLFLPLRCKFERATSKSCSLTLGAKKLSKTTLMKTLAEIEQAGDPTFVFELRDSKEKLLALLPTKASLIVHSLKTKGGKEVRCNEQLPRFHKKSNLRMWMRWWFCAIIFCAGCWALTISPHKILTTTPSLWKPVPEGTFAAALPLHPTTMEQAFELGILHERLTSCEQPLKSRECTVDSILRDAEKVVGKVMADTATHDQLIHVLEDIKEYERGSGLASRVRGLFNFVNFVWFLSILGITVSIGPSLYHLLKPIREYLHRVAEWLLWEVIVPMCKRLHNWGIFEVCAFSFCFLGVAQGFRMKDAEVSANEMVSLTGSILALPCFSYSTLLWGGRLAKNTSHTFLAQLVQGWLFCSWAPLAVHFSSTLFGFLAISALFGILGFGVGCRGLCYYIGFISEDALQRCTVVGGILISTFTGLRACNIVPSPWLSPFETPVAIMGSVVFLLGLLIISCKWYDSRHNYVRDNGYMAVAILATTFFGNTFGMNGMANTGKTFAGLWIMRLYSELHDHLKLNGWLLMLVLSMFTWQASLYLHENPNHIASMFTV